MAVKKPIKRNPAIVTFSKEHHFALLLIWKIREGLKKSIDPARISRYIVHFYVTDLIYHFTDEEKILFNKLPSDNPHRIHAETDHKNINQMIDELKKDSVDKALLEKFADTLEKHIRFEEREFFNYLQENVSEDVLTEIESSLRTRAHESDTAWDDMFWEIKK
jgi:hemerythrin-like domain-containing protein